MGFTEADAQRLQAILAGAAARKPKRNKYRTSPPEARTVGDIVFDSKREARRYLELLQLRQVGALRPPYILRQVAFHLPGRTVYRLDFLVFLADGSVRFEDVKGYRTEVYRLKKRQVEELYGIEVQEV